MLSLSLKDNGGGEGGMKKKANVSLVTFMVVAKVPFSMGFCETQDTWRAAMGSQWQDETQNYMVVRPNIGAVQQGLAYPQKPWVSPMLSACAENGCVDYFMKA